MSSHNYAISRIAFRELNMVLAVSSTFFSCSFRVIVCQVESDGLWIHMLDDRLWFCQLTFNYY